MWNKMDFLLSRATFYEFEATEKNKSPAGGKAASHLPAQSALSSALMVKNAFEKTRIWLGSSFNDYW